MTLRAGALTARFDASDGSLRDVTIGGARLLDRLYGAVRDDAWRTIPGVVTVLSSTRNEIVFESVHGDLFRWTGRIDIGEEISMLFSGEVLRTFDRNRIGLCLHHPAHLAGMPCRTRTRAGDKGRTRFPADVDPRQPLAGLEDLEQLAYDRLRVVFSGAPFETEDQRNWTDASYKSYSGSLRDPFPVTVTAGTRMRQRVTLGATSKAEDGFFRELPDDRPVATLLGLGTHPENGEWDRDALRALGVDHLRIDVDPDRPNWPSEVRALARAAEGIPIELAVLALPGEADLFLKARDAVGDAPLARVLALPRHEFTLVAPDHTTLYERAKLAFPDTAVHLGTDSDFIFVNRHRPSVGDGTTFAIQPQAHAFDDESVMGTLPIQETIVRQAVSWGRPVAVSPVTLLPRHVPYVAVHGPRGVPPVDPRLHSDFGAAWLRASVAAVRGGGATSATYFETHGPRGVLGTPIESVWRALR